MCVIWCSVRVCKIRNDIQYSRHYSATLHKHRIYAIWELRPRIMCCFCCMLAAPRSVDSLGGPISSICPPKNGQFDRRNRMRSTTSRIYGSPGGGRQTSATVLLLMRPLCTVVVTNLKISRLHMHGPILLVPIPVYIRRRLRISYVRQSSSAGRLYRLQPTKYHSVDKKIQL